MPCLASWGRRSSCQVSYWRATKSWARLEISVTWASGLDAVGRGVLGLEVVVELGLEAGDADLEELVEVRRRDRQEPELLQERVRGVAGLFQDPLVEVEPAQLAVDEEAGVGRGRRATAVAVASPRR